jgi:hypothetical protein
VAAGNGDGLTLECGHDIAGTARLAPRHRSNGRGRLIGVERGSARFVIVLLIMIAMICIWPDIVMALRRWLS